MTIDINISLHPSDPATTTIHAQTLQLRLSSRGPVLFCCSVAETDPSHLPRSFVSPGRHLRNTQLKGFLECADDLSVHLFKCDVSHMVEVTTRLIYQNVMPYGERRPPATQWKVPATTPGTNSPTPPSEDPTTQHGATDEHPIKQAYTTYQSMSTRCFVIQSNNKTWQAPPHSRAFRESHGDSTRTKFERKKYMEITPFRTMPYASDNAVNGNVGVAGARAWVPSCSMILWCSRYNNLYEVHVFS
jgi:hypothetical protein